MKALTRIARNTFKIKLFSFLFLCNTLVYIIIICFYPAWSGYSFKKWMIYLNDWNLEINIYLILITHGIWWGPWSRQLKMQTYKIMPKKIQVTILQWLTILSLRRPIQFHIIPFSLQVVINLLQWLKHCQDRLTTSRCVGSCLITSYCVFLGYIPRKNTELENA